MNFDLNSAEASAGAMVRYFSSRAERRTRFSWVPTKEAMLIAGPFFECAWTNWRREAKTLGFRTSAESV